MRKKGKKSLSERMRKENMKGRKEKREGYESENTNESKKTESESQHQGNVSPERKEKEWRERAREKIGHKSSLQTCGTTIERGCEEKFSE